MEDLIIYDAIYKEASDLVVNISQQYAHQLAKKYILQQRNKELISQCIKFNEEMNAKYFYFKRDKLTFLVVQENLGDENNINVNFLSYEQFSETYNA